MNNVLIGGTSVMILQCEPSDCDIARSAGMTEAAVKAVIDRQNEDQLGGVQLRRELLFEVLRLRALGKK